MAILFMNLIIIMEHVNDISNRNESLRQWFLKVWNSIRKIRCISTFPIDLDDQQHDLCDRSFSSSSAGGVGHYCTHSSNDSTRPLISHQQSTDNPENFKHSAPPSTGSSSHSSSGIGSSMESPYNHWKYLTPLSVTTTNETNNFLSSTEQQSLNNNVLEPGSISSTWWTLFAIGLYFSTSFFFGVLFFFLAIFLSHLLPVISFISWFMFGFSLVDM